MRRGFRFEEPEGRRPSTHGKVRPCVERYLDACPTIGSGVHAWIFNAALGALRDSDMTLAEITARIEAGVQGCGRSVPAREIQGAIRSAQEAAGDRRKMTAPTGYIRPAKKWPDPDPARIELAVRSSEVTTVNDLIERSPCDPRGRDACWSLNMLFPGDPLLCVGRSNSDFLTTHKLRWAAGDLAAQQFIVPSPMTSQWGITKEGKPSQHTLENTGPRTYLVVESDQGGVDQQAAVVWHLSKFLRLSAVVFSGGRSLHAWFHCLGQPEADLLRFYRYAHVLGGDHAPWTRSQFVRMPYGTRDDGARQRLLFMNPSTRPLQ